MPLRRVLQRNIRLQKQAVFDAGGSATVVIGPVPVGPSWEIKQITVKTTVTALLSSATTFVGTNNAGTFISNTLKGNNDTDSQPNTTIRYGESVCAVWTNGTPGRVATLGIVYDEVDY